MLLNQLVLSDNVYNFRGLFCFRDKSILLSLQFKKKYLILKFLGPPLKSHVTTYHSLWWVPFRLEKDKLMYLQSNIQKFLTIKPLF